MEQIKKTLIRACKSAIYKRKECSCSLVYSDSTPQFRILDGTRYEWDIKGEPLTLIKSKTKEPFKITFGESFGNFILSADISETEWNDIITLMINVKAEDEEEDNYIEIQKDRVVRSAMLKLKMFINY